MNAKKMAVVLIAVLVIGTLGGITMGIIDSGNKVENEGFYLIGDFDGNNPPINPNAIPGGDPEHPQ